MNARDASLQWACSVGWDLIQVTTRQGNVILQFEGSLPVPDTASLRAALVAKGIDPNAVRAEFLPRTTVDLGQTGS